jgi:glycyl-tRNA synthetase beta chain
MADYLLEIGLEEMPAHLVTPSVKQLAERLSDFLTDNRIKFEEIVKFSTPRRLAVLVKGLAEQSEAMDEEVKGPAAKIAKDNEGNWSKAIQGFSRGQGVSPDDLILKGDYYFAEKHIEGVKTADLLAKIADEVISKMTFSTYMKWANNDFLFVRPIQWLVSLLDGQVIPLSLLDVSAGSLSRGHRFLANKEIEISSADKYAEVLAENYVIADAEARKLEIAKQIMALAADHDWDVIFDDEVHQDLLEEINNLVEYPTAFVGSFDGKYLEVPAEVLVTSMRDNQRYFEVYDKDGNLVPNFISVRNGNTEFMENVIAGNEKVLVARLEDAKFFWEEDQKLQLADLVAKLSNITFHAKIGSLSEHMARTKNLALELAKVADLTKAETADLARAAEIYKFDLTTGMVNEFDELQGVMGEKYAKIFGENENVAVAIREHYLPNSAEGDLPQTSVGAVLALADKLDALNSFFKAGLIPSGSNDPYALRRATTGVLRIIGSQKWSFDLAEFLDAGEATLALVDFVKDRLRKLLEDDVRHDLIEAALAVPVFNPFAIVKSALALQDASGHNGFKETVENLSRVFNLADKLDIPVAIDPELFENISERQLYETEEALEMIADSWSNLMELTFLAAFIARFFDDTMVMADELAIRNNRLALLKEIADKARQLADFSLVLTK